MDAWPRRPLSRASGARRAALLLAGLLAVAAGCGEGPAPPAPPGSRYESDGSLRVPFERPARLPNLIVIVVDTLRADALEGPGGAGGRMPWLAGLGKRGTLLTQASSSAPWTIPSLASLLTGDSPTRHACRGEDGVPVLAAGRTTFAEALGRGHGYQTAVAAGVGIPGSGGPATLFAGFETVIPAFALQGTEPLLARWVERRDRARPFFLLLHTYEAHHPYGADNHPFPPLRTDADGRGEDPIAALGSNPAAKDLAELVLTSQRAGMWLRSRHGGLMASAVTPYFWSGLRDAPDPDLVRRLKAAYDAGTAWVDGLLERTVQRLGAWGLLEDTVLAVTSDHGEAFGEHGLLMHGRDCHDELVRVPLVLSGRSPFDRGTRVEASVGLLDLLPTFFDLAGLPPLDDVEGRSFLPLLAADGAGRAVLAEEWVSPGKTAGRANRFVVSVRSKRWKVLLTRDLATGAVREEAHDLAADPGERHDLAGAAGGAGGAAAVDALALDDAFRAALATARERLGAFRPVR